MSKRLSVAEIRERIADLESRYHNGHKQGSEWWQLYGDVHPTDRMLWGRYTKLLNVRLQEQKPGNTKCTNCGSDNAISETLSDSETGHIDECADCNYTVVYREDADTGRVIEDYQGFTHEYSGQYKALKESQF